MVRLPLHSFEFESLFSTGFLKFSCCCAFAVVDSLKKSGPVLSGPSPATYPENGTNLSADLLVIYEEITWRPFLFLVRWVLVINNRTVLLVAAAEQHS